MTGVEEEARRDWGLGDAYTAEEARIKALSAWLAGILCRRCRGEGTESQYNERGFHEGQKRVSCVRCAGGKTELAAFEVENP